MIIGWHDGFEESEVCMCGRATVTMVRSSTTMSWGSR